MKKLIYILFAFLMLSCQQSVEVSAGIANSDGDKYILGSDEDTKLAVDLILAYADKNIDYMTEKMADSVTYWPPQGGKSMTMGLEDVPGVVMQLHSSYDSITRRVWNAVPLKISGSDYTRVTVAFSERRYLKDGSQENLRIIDRVFIRDGKIYRIHQWDAEMEKFFLISLKFKNPL